MPLRVLVLALVLVVAPISLTFFIVLFAKPLVAFGMAFLAIMLKAQVTALLILAPIILAVRLYEWARGHGFI